LTPGLLLHFKRLVSNRALNLLDRSCEVKFLAQRLLFCSAPGSISILLLT
jgi:hypothetical protein